MNQPSDVDYPLYRETVQLSFYATTFGKEENQKTAYFHWLERTLFFVVSIATTPE
jgi:hypothetical protein